MNLSLYIATIDFNLNLRSNIAVCQQKCLYKDKVTIICIVLVSFWYIFIGWQWLYIESQFYKYIQFFNFIRLSKLCGSPDYFDTEL